MIHEFNIEKEYLWLPIAKEEPVQVISFFINDKKEYEFKIPISSEEKYEFQFYAPLPIGKWIGNKIRINGEFGISFLEELRQEDTLPVTTEQHPQIHFTATTGWINDPNGMLYHDGVYHLYFQYNPFDTKWENMCWGHAISKDMLHWEQMPTVLYPDEDGTMFSGSGIRNEKEMLGLPKEAYLYFYTCAGDTSEWSKTKQCTQKIAYSLDGGRTLQKRDGVVVPFLFDGSRDPKVYWHEETKGYFMVLFLENNDYAILRSNNLEDWEITQNLTLPDAWECPDLRKISDQKGNEKWMFWSADGYYYLGEFDGYQFKQDGVKREAYCGKLPYAAQTFWGIEDRTVMIPWLRTKNANKSYTGVMGLPRELTLVEVEGELKLAQYPIKEYERLKKHRLSENLKQGVVNYRIEEKNVVEVALLLNSEQSVECNVFGEKITYNTKTGRCSIGDEVMMLQKGITDLHILRDAEIIEIVANKATVNWSYEVISEVQQSMIEVKTEGELQVTIYELCEDENDGTDR